MESDTRIYVAGHRGLVGGAILRRLRAEGFRAITTQTHGQLDLTEQSAVHGFFQAERPEVVFLCAAKVGGIAANSSYPAEFIQVNLAIQNNVIHEAWRAGVERLLFLGSSCIYPRECPQPITERHLLTGPLELTNRPYAVAKIAGVEMCWAYNRQYGTRYVALMPTNLYGPGDNYDLETSHVLPALIRKVHEAKEAGLGQVGVWGTGTPRREFLYSDDLADAAVYLMSLPSDRVLGLFQPDEPPLVNVGSGTEVTIRELIEVVMETVGYEGKVAWDSSRPDGTPRKALDSSRMASLGWSPTTTLRDGVGLAYEAFLTAHASGSEAETITQLE